MLDFIKNNLELFLTFVMIAIELLTFLILSFIKTKKKLPGLAEVLVHLPKIINHVEKLGKTGIEKKSLVLYIAKQLYEKEAGYEATSSAINVIDEAIEDILSTPTKKEEK